MRNELRCRSSGVELLALGFLFVSFGSAFKTKIFPRAIFYITILIFPDSPSQETWTWLPRRQFPIGFILAVLPFYDRPDSIAIFHVCALMCRLFATTTISQLYRPQVRDCIAFLIKFHTQLKFIISMK